MGKHLPSGRRRLRWLMLLCSVALGGSCYNPDLTQVLYKCDNGICPDGLSCIDKKHCTRDTPACNLGGIMIATDTYVCPGLSNVCQMGYHHCPTSVITNLCHLDILDKGGPENCDICCPGASDMGASDMGGLDMTPAADLR